MINTRWLVGGLMLMGAAQVQIGLGLPKVETAQDHDLVGPVKRVVEKLYYAEEEVHPAAQFLRFAPFITRTFTFQRGHLQSRRLQGGRTDAVEQDVTTYFTYAGGCLSGIRLDDHSIYGSRPHKGESNRSEALTPGVGCRWPESMESVFGKPSLRKAFSWKDGAVHVVAYRKDNSVAYTVDSTCFGPALRCQETTPATTGRSRTSRRCSAPPLVSPSAERRFARSRGLTRTPQARCTGTTLAAGSQT